VQNNQATNFPASFNSSAENSCNSTCIVISHSAENPEEEGRASSYVVSGKATGECSRPLSSPISGRRKRRSLPSSRILLPGVITTVVSIIFQQNSCREYKQTSVKINNMYYKEVTPEIYNSTAASTKVSKRKFQIFKQINF
jgi:hypothetical protein